MKNKRKVAQIVLCTLLTGVLLTGCAQKDAAPETNNVTENVVTKETETKVVETEQVKETEQDVNVNESVSTDNVTNDVTETENTTENVSTSDQETKTDIDTNWQSYTVAINGKDITLPCTYEQIQEVTGLSMKSSEEKSYLEHGYYTSVNLRDAEDKARMHIEIVNDTGEDALYTDCKITRISQTAYQNKDASDNMIVFPGGFVAGKELTPDELLQIMGEPTKVHEYSDGDYWSNTYKWNADPTWTTTNYFEVVIKKNVIDSLTIDNR